ncbi:MAG: radical SAM protein [bacterium]|nr:radical SAM protein [bacterium]
MSNSDPNKAFVPLHFECNNNCISCIMPGRASERSEFVRETMKDHISFEYAKKGVDKILQYSDHIEFNGGEPTINKDLFKILDYTNRIKENVEIGLLTNARVFSSEKYTRKLVSLGLKNFKIITSLYGPNAEIHDAVTRTPRSFEQQVAGIHNLIRAKVRIYLRIIINKINSEHINSTAQFLADNFSPYTFSDVILVNMKLAGIAMKNLDAVAYRVTDIMENIEEAADILIENKFRCFLYHFPHCILPRHLWKYSGGVTAEKTQIGFMPECESCLKREQCTGIWKGYIKLYGTSEFKPIVRERND